MDPFLCQIPSPDSSHPVPDGNLHSSVAIDQYWLGLYSLKNLTLKAAHYPLNYLTIFSLRIAIRIFEDYFFSSYFH